MATKRIPFGSPGVPAIEQSDSYAGIELLYGSNPVLGNSFDYPVAQNTDLKINSLVGLDGRGNLTLAVYADDEADAIQPVGVLAVAVKTGPGQTTTARVNRSGSFNINALVYDGSFNTDVKKLNAIPRQGSQLAFGKNPYDPVFT